MVFPQEYTRKGIVHSGFRRFLFYLPFIPHAQLAGLPLFAITRLVFAIP